MPKSASRATGDSNSTEWVEWEGGATKHGGKGRRDSYLLQGLKKKLPVSTPAASLTEKREDAHIIELPLVRDDLGIGMPVLFCKEQKLEAQETLLPNSSPTLQLLAGR